MISVNLFTSGKHTQPLIKALRQAKNIELLHLYQKINQPTKADVFIVADFGYILSKKIIKMPKYGSLCLHPSLLPKYRGASPVQYAIINGEKETGLTIFQMDEKVDHGPIIAQLKEKIKNDDTAETLYQRLFTRGAQLLIKILPQYLREEIKPKPQNHSLATYTPRLSRQAGKIDWRKSDEEIERFIRAMYPWPGAWTTVGSKRLKILKAHLIPDRKYIPIQDRQKLAGRKRLVFDLVQLEGKKPITWQQFLAGHNVRFDM